MSILFAERRIREELSSFRMDILYSTFPGRRSLYPDLSAPSHIGFPFTFFFLRGSLDLVATGPSGVSQWVMAQPAEIHVMAVTAAATESLVSVAKNLRAVF